MGMTEDDKRNCCLVEIQQTEAKYYKTLEDIEKVSLGLLKRVFLLEHDRGAGLSFYHLFAVAVTRLSMEMPRIGQIIWEHKCHKS